MAVNWNELSSGEVEEILSTDLSKGLSPKAAKERYKHSNYKVSLQNKSLQGRYSSLDFFSFAVLLLISAVSYFVMPVWESLLFSLICISAFLLFLTVDEYSRRNISSHLNFFVSHVTVLRGGKQVSVPSHFVVVGDVLKLKKGDTVPCTCYIIDKNGAFFSEEPSDEEKIICQGNVIESGTCTCVSVESASVSNKNPVLEMQHKFITSSNSYKFASRISSFALILVSFFAIIILFADILQKKEMSIVFFDFSSCFVLACGVFVSSFPLLLRFNLAKFLLRDLESKSVYFKNASAVDRLAEVDCAVLDTDMFFSMDSPVPMAFYASNNMILSENAKLSDVGNSSFFDVLLTTELGAADFSPVSQKYLQGLRKCFGSKLMSDAKLLSYRLTDDEFPFDTFLFENAAGDTYASVKGEITSLIRCCSTVSLGNKILGFDDGLKNSVLSAAANLVLLGCEIVAYAKNSNADISLDNTHLSHKRLTFLGFAAFRKGQAAWSDEFFSMCKKTDIEPVFIHYGTANEINIYKKSSEHFAARSFVDCEHIGESIADMRKALLSYDGFLNPSEAQCNSLLVALSQNGTKCAYISRQNKANYKDQYFDFALHNCETGEENDADECSIVCAKSLGAVTSAISSALQYKGSLVSILSFFCFLCFCKVFLLPLSLFTDNIVFTPLKTALFVFVFDLLSFCVFIDNKKIKEVDLKKSEYVFSFKSSLVFALLTVITLFISKIFSLFDYGSDLEILGSVSFLVQLILPPLYLIFEEKLHISESLLIYLLAILILITLCVMFSPVGVIFGVISDVKILIAAVLSSVSFFFLYCGYFKNIKK